jgi:signal transduction histidine kinase
VDDKTPARRYAPVKPFITILVVLLTSSGMTAPETAAPNGSVSRALLGVASGRTCTSLPYLAPLQETSQHIPGNIPHLQENADSAGDPQPFWETWWFRGAALLTLALLAMGGYRVASDRGEAHNRELAAEVEERTREIERRRRVAEGLRDVLAILNSNRPLPEVLDYIARQACELMRASAAVIHHVEYDKGKVTVEAQHGIPALEGESRPATQIYSGYADRAIFNRQPFATPDLKAYVSLVDTPEGDGLDPDEREWRRVTARGLDRVPGGAFLAVPLIVSNDVYGSIALYYDEPRQFSEEDIQLGLSFGHQAALAIENAQLHSQVQELAAVEERQRLARDLHDAVTQTLFSTSLIAEALPQLWQQDPQDGRELLEQVRQGTRSALAEMRTLLLELRPTGVRETDLNDLLRQLAEAIQGRANVSVSVVVQGECALPPEAHVAFYRIAQEALNNVARHSRAREVTVTLQCRSADLAANIGEGLRGYVTLSISDDGIGFDVNDVPTGHLGLEIMRERAAGVGASIAIDSQPGRGTRITVIWEAEEIEPTSEPSAPA